MDTISCSQLLKGRIHIQLFQIKDYWINIFCQQYHKNITATTKQY